jgi:hypothetical protein
MREEISPRNRVNGQGGTGRASAADRRCEAAFCAGFMNRTLAFTNSYGIPLNCFTLLPSNLSEDRSTAMHSSQCP